jgi:hypothetical protein
VPSEIGDFSRLRHLCVNCQLRPARSRTFAECLCIFTSLRASSSAAPLSASVSYIHG